MKTDTQLKNDVLAELSWEPSVIANAIGVEVRDGVVTLSGHVNSYAEKLSAERAAQRVAGLVALAVELDVRLPGLSARTDADIATAASHAMQWASYLEKDSITVIVEDGIVTLGGSVDWQYQREAAANAVRFLMGVRGVSNGISIKPGVSKQTLKGDIEAALERRALADSKQVDVEVVKGVVTLTGNVSSWSERELIRQSAWRAPGVQSVVDRITVS